MSAQNFMPNRPISLLSRRNSRNKGILAAVSAPLLALTFAGFAPTAQADVFRWVDANGTVTYGERIPKGREYTVISRSKPEATSKVVARRSGRRGPANATEAPPPAAPAPVADDNLSAEQRGMLNDLQNAEAERKKALAKLRSSNCETSRRQLTRMQSSGRIRIRKDNGEETAMSEEERDNRIRRAQESIVKNCDSLS